MLSLFPPTPTGRPFTRVVPLVKFLATSRSLAFASMIDSSPVFLSFGAKKTTRASVSTWETGLSPISDSPPTSSCSVGFPLTVPGSSSMAIWSVSSTIVTEAFSTIFDAMPYPSVVRP